MLIHSMKRDVNDALIGLGRRGEISFNFIREAVSLKAALLSAMADLKQAIPRLGETRYTKTANNCW